MIKVVSFEEIVQWLCTKQQPLWVDKLGRKEKNGIVCHFFSSYEPTSKTILITGDDGLNGKPSTIYRFDKTRWDAVMQFMGTLPYAERYISNRYGKHQSMLSIWYSVQIHQQSVVPIGKRKEVVNEETDFLTGYAIGRSVLLVR